jgi:hypothetical protein
MKRILLPLFFVLLCPLLGQHFSHASSNPTLSSAKCTYSALYSGTQLTCTATLNKSATGAQFFVYGFSGPLSLVTPAPQLVFTGTTGTFTVLAGSVTKNTAASFTVNAYSKSIVVKLTVQPSGNPPPLTYSLTASPTSVAFGNVTVGQTASKTVTLTSTGTGTVDITGVTMPVPVFSTTGLTDLTTLASGASATFTVGFKPTMAGAETGSLVITSNGSPVSISMIGTGVVTAPTITPTALSCTPSTITGAGTCAGTVTLSSAPTVATAVPVASSNPSVTLTEPSVAAGATTGSFVATAAAVTVAIPVTLTASLNGASAITSLTLEPVSTVAYQVELSWTAPPAGNDPATGYHVYRALGSGAYILLASSSTTAYTDITPVDGDSYNYEIRSVDAGGIESSGASNVYTAVIP